MRGVDAPDVPYREERCARTANASRLMVEVVVDTAPIAFLDASCGAAIKRTDDEPRSPPRVRARPSSTNPRFPFFLSVSHFCASTRLTSSSSSSSLRVYPICTLKSQRCEEILILTLSCGTVI